MLVISRFMAAIVFAAALAVTACSSFTPEPLERAKITERAETQERDGLRVRVAVLSRDEAAKVFGVELHKHGVQPIWL